jgi:hypothetical protein
MLPVTTKVWLEGSYNSADERRLEEKLFPPAMSTLPLFSRVATAPDRSVIKLAAGGAVNVPALYSSAPATKLFALLPGSVDMPPAMSTVPSVSRVAEWRARGKFSWPVGTKFVTVMFWVTSGAAL